jgi:hypothetical protein
MQVDSKELIVPCSETRAGSYQASLSDRLTVSLISAGLVNGIIPMSMRDVSGQQILEHVFDSRAGEGVVKRKVA